VVASHRSRGRRSAWGWRSPARPREVCARGRPARKSDALCALGACGCALVPVRWCIARAAVRASVPRRHARTHVTCGREQRAPRSTRLTARRLVSSRPAPSHPRACRLLVVARALTRMRARPISGRRRRCRRRRRRCAFARTRDAIRRLKRAIAMGYVASGSAAAGTQVLVEVRTRARACWPCVCFRARVFFLGAHTRAHVAHGSSRGGRGRRRCAGSAPRRRSRKCRSCRTSTARTRAARPRPSYSGHG
jgi:hypothetical protein